MDLLLIHAGPTVEERYGNKRFGDVGGLLPPLGLASLAAYLRERGFVCSILDTIANNISTDELINFIIKSEARVLGFTALTPSFHKVRAIAKAIKMVLPDIPIVLGGHHATVLKESVLDENSPFDIAVYGEGEETLREVMESLKECNFQLKNFLKSRDVQNIHGIVFRKDGVGQVNPPRALIPDIDLLPFPARDLLPMDKYIPLPNQYKTPPVVHMVITRGCPFSCSFCSNNAVFGRKVRKRSPALVIEEIKQVVKRYGAREISFWDDTLTVDKKWLAEVCEGILKNGLKINWSCYASVNTVDREILSLMKKAGCWNIFYGYESGVQELLDNIDKGITLEQIEFTNEITKRIGIEVRASFMLALPGETPELAMKTLDFSIKLNPDYVQFSLTTPFPGTKLYKEAKKYGTLCEDFSEYVGWKPVFIPYGYSDAEDLLRVQQICHRRFYFRLGYILKCIKKIRTGQDILRLYKGLKMAIGFSF